MLGRSSIGIALIFVATAGIAQQGWFWQDPLPSGKWLYGVYFADGITGWTVGRRGTILHTTDGGDNWIPEVSGTSNWLESVYFTDVNTGWAVGHGGTILHTTDGGSDWTAQTSGTSSCLFSVYFTDANTGWAVGWAGTILHTTTGGTRAKEDGDSIEFSRIARFSRTARIR